MDESKHVAIANAHAAQRMVAMSMQREAELKEQARSIQAALVLAEKASEQKSMFLANISHELRTPLNGILGMATVMLDEERDPEVGAPLDRTEHLEMLLRSGECLLEIVNDVLDLSKIECGGLYISNAAFDLRQLVLDLAAVLDAGNQKAGVSVKLELADDVPAIYRGDAMRLRQILMNLAGNALKFTESGSVGLVVTRENDRLKFLVKDSGCGIADGEIDGLFEPFAQVDSTTARAQGGTGLGLSISLRLAELMDGSIGARSTLGEGSEFWLMLPLVPTEECVSELESVAVDVRGAEEVAAGDRVRRGSRVLLVDDNAINRRVASAYLNRLGCIVEEQCDGAAAVAAVAAAINTPFDLVLLDRQMPVMDGYEAARKIRAATGGDGPVIVALTAHAMAEDRERCLRAGMDDYLTKPVRKADLTRLLTGLRALGERTPPEPDGGA